MTHGVEVVALPAPQDLSAAAAVTQAPAVVTHGVEVPLALQEDWVILQGPLLLAPQALQDPQ